MMPAIATVTVAALPGRRDASIGMALLLALALLLLL
jgi:hypothetical protein